ncbi:MAG: hypothetical protein QG588_906, partial [Candidatus Poribacteria bacterium]|nr:hypothetical protein [Candidatus Poribacteria bacterium]
LPATDVEKDSLIFKRVDFPRYGKAEFLSTNQVIYVPNKDYNGTDSFTFVANDGLLDSNTATVSITIEPVNDLPIANPQTIKTPEDTPVNIMLTGSDIDSAVITFKRTSAPSYGIIEGTEPNLKYTPNPDFFGEDSFTFTANDGSLESNIATIKITVESVNDPPTANSQSVTTNEKIPVDIVLKGSDIESDPLTYKIDTYPLHGFLSGNPPTLKYIPNDSFFGNDSFTFVTNDRKADSLIAKVTINVNKINQPPFLSLISVTTNEDTPVKITLTGNDPNNDPLTFKLVSQPAKGTLDGSSPDFTYTPKLNFNGNDSFTFIANDGEVDSNIGTLCIIVNPVNDAPISDNQSVSTDEDTPLKITLTATDPENDKITFKIVDKPLNGILSGTPPAITYMPNAEFNGEDSFTFTASDGKLESPPAKVSITVKPVNDPPIANSQSVTTDEETSVKITLTGSDVDSPNLTFKIVDQPLNGFVEWTPPEPTYMPNANFNGDDSFTFIANDGKIDSKPAKVSIQVNPVNDPPVAVAQSVITDEDTATKITLTGTDPENDKLTFKIVDQPVNGTLELNMPEVTYKPKAEFNGDDSFTFTANDGKLDSKPEKVSIKVNPVNDLPVANEKSVTTNESVPVKITLTGSDPEGDTFTFKVTVQPSNGTLIGTPPDLTYEPKYGFGGDDSFMYVVNDGKLDSKPVAVKITVSLMANPFDVNHDGIVNILDFAIVSIYFGKTVFPLDHNPDVNRDGKIDFQDISVIQKNFGKKL